MTPLPKPPLRVALIGAGNVGTAVAQLLQQAGHEVVAVASRSDDSAERAAARLGTHVVEVGDLPQADLVLLGVPEHALAETGAAIGDVRGGVVVHFAGVVGIEPLREAKGASAICALHPVQTCPDVDSAITALPGCAWGVTCSEGARQWAHRLIEEDLKGLPVDVGGEDRALWHAAAVTMSNGLSALAAVAESMLTAIGIEEPGRVVGPIAAATLANARDRGGAATLTGPVVRKEMDVIARHLDQLEQRAPHLKGAFVDAIEMIASSAAAAERISDEDVVALEKVLHR